jgi:tRNA A-37 threonylcarbamoyl transferase component Bud32
MAEGEQTLRRYDLLERIAVGGMAEIFRAKAHGAHGFEKTLAIKRILPDLARDAEFETRFIAEAKLAVALTHANLVQIFDFGRFAGSLYIAMEYVDGPDLGRVLKAAAERGETVPLGAAMHVAMEVCKGLDVAHARRVVHSDISPSNILLSRLGEVKIADFGIARAAADGGPAAVGAANRVMGKWPYMSPEQTRGEPLDVRSDLFSAAVVFYELLTGEKLFHGEDVGALVESVRTMPIPPASSRRTSLPPALDGVLARALERDPARRYQQASELLRAFLEVSYSHTLVATAMDVAGAVGRWFPPAPPDAPSGPIDADALIREDLGLGSAPSNGTSAPRHTVRGTTPANMAMMTAAGAPADAAAPLPAGAGESGKTVALPDARPGKVTFVRGERGADGIPVWELTIAGDPAVVPPPRPMAAPKRERRGRPLLGLVGLLLVGAVVPRLWRRHETAAATAARAELTVESTPAGARVLLDGREAPTVTPTTLSVEHPRPDEPHRLELRLPGYRAWEARTIALRPGDHAIYRAQLEAPATRLVITTDPPGAEVAVDGRTVGRTPLGNVTLAADGRTHALRLRRHGFLDVTDMIALADGKDVVVDRKLPPAPRYGTIDLHVDPWALVYLDGKQVGEAPVKGLQLPVGHHRLKLVNPVRHKQMMLAVEVPGTHPYRVKLP